MSGKKVFTHAGELLANFFSIKRNTDNKATKNEDVLEYLGKSEILQNTEVDKKEFEKQYELNKQQTLTEIDNYIFKKFNNYKITDGVKEIPVNEMTQRLYHDLKNVDATTQAQFKALAKFLSIKMAEQIKNSNEQYRQFSYEISKGSTALSNLVNRPLDYFVGSAIDAKRIYYKFSGNRLLVANGDAQNQTWIEIFRMSSVSVGGQAQAGTDFMIGGASGDRIATVSINKPTNINGDLKVTNGEIYGIVTASRFADVAEFYSCNKKLASGSLVGINNIEPNCDSGSYDEDVPDKVGEIKLYNTHTEYLGVVSSKPGFVLNKPFDLDPSCKIGDELWSIPIVLTGRSPVKLINKGKRGDSIFVPNKIIGNNIEEKQFLQGKALCYSRGEYKEYLKFNEPLQKIGVLLYDSVYDEHIETEEYSKRDSYIGLAKIN